MIEKMLCEGFFVSAVERNIRRFLSALVLKMKKEIREVEKQTRLNKYLSDAGVCSRREADRLIETGKILVNGKPALLGTKAGPGDIVTYQGKEVLKKEKIILIAFNKPKGVVCTTDHREPDNIIDYIHYSERIYPIGRLDKDSEGLILLTNYGELSDKILRGSNYHEKEYVVTVNKPVTEKFIKKMEQGVPILNTVTRRCRIKQSGPKSFHIILTQGLNRQIRRMCEYFDYKVVSLQRIRIMNINLGRLETGHYRNVTESELKRLDILLQGPKEQKYGKHPAGNKGINGKVK